MFEFQKRNFLGFELPRIPCGKGFMLIRLLHFTQISQFFQKLFNGLNFNRHLF
ncbi:hypothetical protein ABIE50_003978 [Chitinophaga sp. OAE865]